MCPIMKVQQKCPVARIDGNFNLVPLHPCTHTLTHLHTFTQIVKKHYCRFARQQMTLRVSFESREITLDIPENGIKTCQGWRITPRSCPTVRSLIALILTGRGREGGRRREKEKEGREGREKKGGGERRKREGREREELIHTSSLIAPAISTAQP